MTNEIYLGNNRLTTNSSNVEGVFENFDGEQYYKINNYDQMADFFMTIVSESDHWMFISSNGSLSAGRKDRDNALFPYYTDDKIQDYAGKTGSITHLIVARNEKNYLWSPFTTELPNIYKIERNIYKNTYGNKIIFEEINHDLNVSFKYGWYNTETYGFVKRSIVKNLSETDLNIKVLDGIANILPSGVGYDFQNEYSNLLDGYKKSELIVNTGLGLFLLSAIPVDKAEPSESLNATTVWCNGLSEHQTLLSSNQINKFKSGQSVTTEIDIKGTRGAYFVSTELLLTADESKKWFFAAEVNQSTTDVANLNHFLKDSIDHKAEIDSEIIQSTQKLVQIVASSDGLQRSNEKLLSARHYSNTLYNLMRGGVYLDNYQFDKIDVIDFINTMNPMLSPQHIDSIKQLPETFSREQLISMANEIDDADLIRLCQEYLPLTFSRRHGDPSRPWNLFSIINKKDDDAKSDYQGNWRDIFQNWEALCLSFPDYIENIICKFINASTADGYNPYRIMRDGIDWESPNENDPWAYIGYWGDHQIIYLQKLLELSKKYHPDSIQYLLNKDIFAYANVPYRIKSYNEIINTPHDTITFDTVLDKHIKAEVGEYGADARLLRTEDRKVLHVNLAEKILVTLLTKLSNFVPEAGIWLNTQRPEWNDANNALVGNGASMVTLYYLRRFLKFWSEIFSSYESFEVYISEPVHQLLMTINLVFIKHRSIVNTGFTDQNRRQITDSLGTAGSIYRQAVYNQSLSGDKRTITGEQLSKFISIAMEYIDQSINANRRDDGLYHAYNLISFNRDSVSIRHLYEMLEGQVAILSSGYLDTAQCLTVLDSLKSSKLFREEQYSYLLYPDRELAKFTAKNNIPSDLVEHSRLLSQLITDNETSILRKDLSGNYHFNGQFKNADYLQKALDNLNKDKYAQLLEQEKPTILGIYEDMFDHQSYTGRSGTFYAYEGLGSIYWHMVSKLRLAVNECYFTALKENADVNQINSLKQHYYEIKAGIGLYKTPELYGAFPTDAYSHTVRDAGVKQPGMTGQVKEDVISRMAEIGVSVEDGCINFSFSLLNPKEFITDEKIFDCYLLDGSNKQYMLQQGQLGFTVCQVPVIYSYGKETGISITLTNGSQQHIEGSRIGPELSSSIFSRTNQVSLIEVSIKNN